MPKREKFYRKVRLSRVAYITYFLMFSKSSHPPGLWLCIKRILDQLIVKETTIYQEQLLFKKLPILAFLALKPSKFNWKLLLVNHPQTWNWLFRSDLYTQPQIWRVRTFFFCNISHPTEYFVRLNFLSKNLYTEGVQTISWNHMEVVIYINLRNDKLI